MMGTINRMQAGIRIDDEKCSYCMECVEACRGDCLTEYEGEIYIDNSECQLCECCFGYCDAITLTFTDGTTIQSSIYEWRK